MTTYYVSTAGSNSNNGLGPDASHASNKPWLTLGKALASGSSVVPGDVIYVAPGTYYAAGSTPIVGVCSVANPTQIIGDPTNAQGFKDGSGVRLAPGQPLLTTRTSTEGLDNGPVVPGQYHLFNCNNNAPSGLQLKKLALESYSSLFLYNGTGSTDLLVEDCYFHGAQVFNNNNGTTNSAGRNFTARRNVLLCAQMGISNSSTAATTANADLNILFEENLIFSNMYLLSLCASGGNLCGGLTYKNNTVLTTGNMFLYTTAGRVSTVTPIRAQGNLVIMTAGGAPMNAGDVGAIVDDGYNRIVSPFGSAFVNVTKHGTTVNGAMANLVLPHLTKWGLEMPRDDFLGWTDAAATAQKFSASGIVTADFHGRTPRPWGAGASIGCWQAQDVTQDTASAITGGGTNSLKLTGAGEVSLYIPVDATGFTVSVRTKSTSYGGTNYPQMIVVANPSVGVTTDTTVTAAAATEETITTATITPTSKGVMEIRLISRSTSVSSTTHFDLLKTT